MWICARLRYDVHFWHIDPKVCTGKLYFLFGVNLRGESGVDQQTGEDLEAKPKAEPEQAREAASGGAAE